jgi:1-aminocyclopropane-1-carboxylate deaminase/D-cysteine desulfhydrase-like pyridoxal-dependent ACC family enzyme
LQHRIAHLAAEVLALLNMPALVKPDEVLVNDDYLGGGYGVVGPAEIEAIQLFARYEGLLLDPVYTARAAAGLIDLARKGGFSETESVLFWHTGGTPALFAERYRPSLAGMD